MPFQSRGWNGILHFQPRLSSRVYQTRLEVEYAVPTATLVPRVHRGSMPGPPGAKRGPLEGINSKLLSEVNLVWRGHHDDSFLQTYYWQGAEKVESGDCRALYDGVNE